MFGQAVHATAGIGIGTFLGVLIVTFAMRRSGRKVLVLKDSPFFTALVAGMGAWTLAAVMSVVLRVMG